MAQDGGYRRLMAEQAREAPASDAGAPAPVARPAVTAETVADVPGGAIAAPTEGGGAEGMTWARVVRVLMGLMALARRLGPLRFRWPRGWRRRHAVR